MRFWFDFVVCYVNVPGYLLFMLLALPWLPAFHVTLHFQRYLLPGQLKDHLPHHLCLQLVVQGEEEKCHLFDL